MNLRWCWGKFTVHTGRPAKAKWTKVTALYQRSPFLKRKMWTQSRFNIKNGNKNQPVNTRCTNHLKKRVKYLLLNGRCNWPFYKKGTSKFCLLRATGSIFWLKNVIYITVLKWLSWSIFSPLIYIGVATHWRRFKFVQDFWGYMIYTQLLSVSDIG